MINILVVDDDIDLRDTLCDALELAGHRPIAARDGSEALERLRSDHNIHIVLLDLMMPGMNGWEFRAAQMADPHLRGIPVIVMTAAADLSKSPVDATLIVKKPLTLSRVLEAVASHALPAND